MSIFPQRPETWQPPIELQTGTPRAVQWTATGKLLIVAMVALTITAVGGSIALAGKAESDQQRWESWKSEAISAPGEVVALRKTGRGDKTRYFVDYSYRAADGSHTSTATVRSREWKNLRDDQPIDVMYRRSSPQTSWLAGHEPKGMPGFVPMIFGAAFMVPVAIIAYVLHRNRRLLENGYAALGTVVAVRRFKSQHGSHFVVSYEFATYDGQQRSGKYNAGRVAPATGDHITVVYDPAYPKSRGKYPLDFVCVRQC